MEYIIQFESLSTVIQYQFEAVLLVPTLDITYGVMARAPGLHQLFHKLAGDFRRQPQIAERHRAALEQNRLRHPRVPTSVVARDGIEPPTPAFSGLRSTN